ncbi:MAG: hypothetical protein ACRDJO_11465 [Actinomycetota bacterium]
MRNDAGGMSPAILVGGRTYEDPEALRRDVKEAWKHLQKAGVLFDIETTWGRNMSIPRDVPSWQQYRRTVVSGSDPE